jgi:Aminoglycoside-2''-adenylyltransferase
MDFARDRDKRSQPEPAIATEQLAALARLDGVLAKHKIPYWLFGGWAVDFHAGSVTRSHDDLDIAVWSKDYERIAELLATDGWQHTPGEGEDGYTAYTRGTVRLEVAFLARDQGGTIYTPLREGQASWPEGAFEGDVAELAGVRARVITLAALKAEKSQDRDDPVVAAKDRADIATLSRVT